MDYSVPGPPPLMWQRQRRGWNAVSWSGGNLNSRTVKALFRVRSGAGPGKPKRALHAGARFRFWFTFSRFSIAGLNNFATCYARSII
jgi:hypothetical protein